MNMIQALNSAMDVLLDKNPDIVIFGEDTGYFGGVFRTTDGLQKKYGVDRVFDTPINEGAIAAMAIGMSAKGLKPIAEIQFADYIFPAFDQIVSEMSRIRYRSAGQFTTGCVVRAPWGGGIRGGQTHSMSPEAFFTHIPGVKVAIPSNPHDAKGMLIAAAEGNDPVIFFEPKRIYNGPFDGVPDAPLKSWAKHPKGEVPDGHYTVELGKADVTREGSACTVVTYGTLVHVAEAAAEKSSIDAEIIDLRTLTPYDIETIAASVNKTGRVVVAHEAPRTSGFGAELAAQIQEECFYALEAPIYRLTGWDTPYPHAHEWAYFPIQSRFIRALETVTEAV
ncbi:alpha-ketoacid dehydrogenase subunit beta [Marinicauda salina]|uniref:3-methyl-2-oxobutanoate dehydrogenase (2-methylpropanoyl-transferring) n=2 Tax=Marinicauda salina TaxID=2135793 RepID=A0A2U2BSA2_9PROT|nr:alpha-ketoacid dehydrogenase subunit beta [Marinicauda salina]